MEVELTRREQLIERILRMPADQVTAVEAFFEQLEDAEDLAIIEARKNEPTISIDDYIRESGLDREEIERIARAEGWMK
ncbi:MAG: hypothetical protein M1546_13460 [Chloroflexi bacterium]|nr:hypothetical protein [Chloroflexota bacterium]